MSGKLVERVNLTKAMTREMALVEKKKFILLTNQLRCYTNWNEVELTTLTFQPFGI